VAEGIPRQTNNPGEFLDGDQTYDSGNGAVRCRGAGGQDAEGANSTWLHDERRLPCGGWPGPVVGPRPRGESRIDAQAGHSAGYNSNGENRMLHHGASMASILPVTNCAWQEKFLVAALAPFSLRLFSVRLVS
jgi:hypothetical protein